MLRRTAGAAIFCATVGHSIITAQIGAGVAERVAQLTRTTKWTRVAAIVVPFDTFHPQGMVKIGPTIVISAVEVRDRAAGKGIGHLFKIDAADGRLITDRTIGEGAIYHPGGIDYDGKNIWVPVAEYRPDSRAIVYRVDPESMAATEVLRVNDHVGAIVHDVEDDSLHGVSWGSRRFYVWKRRRPNGWRPPSHVENPSHYLDYQDCKYAGRHRMVCGGVTELRQLPDAPPFRLGGIDLVDLLTGRPLHQSPVLLWTPDGLDMTHNPLWLETTSEGLRVYFLPEDNRSTLYVYESRP